jgi:hypothetical protein
VDFVSLVGQCCSFVLVGEVNGGGKCGPSRILAKMHKRTNAQLINRPTNVIDMDRRKRSLNIMICDLSIRRRRSSTPVGWLVGRLAFTCLKQSKRPAALVV